MRKFLFPVIIAFTMSSCASILNSRYQKVTIDTQTGNKVLVNGEEPQMKNGKYVLKRDRLPKQITVTHEGMKDENTTMVQYKKSPLYIMSWIPFVVLVYPPISDNGPKAWDYDKQLSIGHDMVSIPKRMPDDKQIRLNKISANIPKENVKFRYFYTYKYFLSKEHKKEAEANRDGESIEIQNTVFTDLLNEVLKEKGYIDTTNKVLTSSYTNNLLIDATVRDYTLHKVNTTTLITASGTGFVYADLSVEWQALDYYRSPVYTLTTNTTSGRFAYNYKSGTEAAYNAVKDALEYGFIEFMNSSEVQKLLKDKSQELEEASFTELVIPKASKYVSSLTEGTKSSVTVKNKNGHGSGFIISSEGHIITNYHVVSDGSALKVVLNNGTQYDAEVVRVSKINDLALLKIAASNLVPFRIADTDDVEIASEVYVIGTPSAEDLSQTVSRGIISAVRNTDSGSKLIQTDASVNAGNSGGAIVSKDSRVIGVVSSKLTGYGIEGVAFGIPATEITDKLKIAFK